MSASSNQCFGRQRTLDWLKRHVEPWREDKEGSPIVLLHGAEGVGLSTILQQFLASHHAADGGQKIASFHWKGRVKSPSLDLFAKRLLGSMATNIPELDERRSSLELDFDQELMFGLGDRQETGGTYTSSGDAQEMGHTPVPFGMENETELATACSNALSDWLENGELIRRLEMDELFLLVFVLDDFDTFPTWIKSWLGRHLFPALSRNPGVPDLAFVLTGRQSWESGGQGAYWKAPVETFHQKIVDPLDRQACEDWLMCLGKSLSLVDALYEQTEGYPGRIAELLNMEGDLAKHLESQPSSLDPLSKFSPQERRWLHAVSMERSVSLELLQLMLGKVEGTQAFGWLSRNVQICHVEQGNNGEYFLGLTLQMRDLVRDRLSEKVPARHREFAEKIRLISSVRSKVGQLEHRNHLRVLTPIQPFNDNLIEEVFTAYA